MLSEAAGARAREPPSKKARRSTCEKLYPAMADIVSRIAAWRQQRGLASHTQQIVPDPQQMRILEAVAERCATEAGEQDSQRGSPCARMLVLGLPGSGKSEVIRWLCDESIGLFPTCLGWEHDVHCIKTAPMNSMASNIGGATQFTLGARLVLKIVGADTSLQRVLRTKKHQQ